MPSGISHYTSGMVKAVTAHDFLLQKLYSLNLRGPVVMPISAVHSSSTILYHSRSGVGDPIIMGVQIFHITI